MVAQGAVNDEAYAVPSLRLQKINEMGADMRGAENDESGRGYQQGVIDVFFTIAVS